MTCAKNGSLTTVKRMLLKPTIAIVGSGLVDKLIQLWRLRRSICEAKAEMSVPGTLAQYTYKAGEAIMSKTLTYQSSYMTQLFKKRNTDITKEEILLEALNMYENYICHTRQSFCNVNENLT